MLELFELTTIHLFQRVEVSSFVVKQKSYPFKKSEINNNVFEDR